MRSRLLLVSAVVLALVLAACGGSAKPASSPTTETPGSAHVLKAAGANPSDSAQMICKSEAVKDISEVLGVTPTSITTPTWKDHVYSCDYVYAGGARMTLHVKELDNATDTTEYFDAQGKALGHKQDLQGLGQGAFTTGTGIVVRKDYKVLTIDISRLPAEFGVPSDTRENASINAAATIMGCWTGE